MVQFGSIITYIYKWNVMWKQKKTEQNQYDFCLCPMTRSEKGAADFSLRGSYCCDISIIVTTIKIDFWASGRESSKNKSTRVCLIHFMNYAAFYGRYNSDTIWYAQISRKQKPSIFRSVGKKPKNISLHFLLRQ